MLDIIFFLVGSHYRKSEIFVLDIFFFFLVRLPKDPPKIKICNILIFFWNLVWVTELIFLHILGKGENIFTTLGYPHPKRFIFFHQSLDKFLIFICLYSRIGAEENKSFPKTAFLKPTVCSHRISL